MIMTMTRPQALRAVNGEPFNSLFGDLVGEFFRPAYRSDARPAEIAAQARLDVVEKGDHYAAYLEMPGVKKEDIEVRIEGGRVAVTAESRGQEALKEGERVVYSERFATRWARTFELPNEVDDSRAEAAYENGILALTLPKKQETLPRKLAIK